MTQHFETSTLAENVQHLMGDLLSWRDEIEAALAHVDYTHTFDDIVTAVLRQEMQFYSVDDCFALCHVSAFPQFSNYHIFIAGGNLNKIVEKQKDFVAIANAMGCKNLTFNGRLGWSKVLKNSGWKEKLVTMWLGADNE